VENCPIQKTSGSAADPLVARTECSDQSLQNKLFIGKTFVGKHKGGNTINKQTEINARFGLLNIRSLLHKYDKIYNLLEHELDVFSLVETWHRSHDEISIHKSMPPGFSYFDFLRPNDPGHGGIVIFFRSNLYCKRISLPTLMHFEALAVKLIVNNCDCVIVTIYRPGSAQLNRHFL